MLRIPARATTSYAIKRPNTDKQSWAIQSVVGTKRRTLRGLDAVRALNKEWLAGALLFNDALKRIEAIRAGLYAARDRETAAERQFNSENEKLLAKYWAVEYTDRDLVDAESMRRSLERAVEACGVVGIEVADRNTLQLQINSYFERQGEQLGRARIVSRQRRAVARLNSLLRFARREFRLRKWKPLRNEVRHLTWDELELVLVHLPDHETKHDLRLLARVAWVTGARLGEIFALQKHNVQTRHVVVATQIDDEGVRRETKTRSERRSLVLRGAQGIIWTDGWATRDWGTDCQPPRRHPETGKLLAPPSLRHIRHATIFKAACKKAFPDRRDKWCCFHDLRHSYAIELLNCGVPIEHVALNLGNSVAVCERHYVGFIQKDAGLEMVARLVSEARGWKWEKPQEEPAPESLSKVVE